MGIVDQAAVIPVGAGEGALAIAEQFTFQQMLRKRRAVLHHKALAAPRSVVMDGPCHQLLAGAGLAGDHHRHRVVQYLADELIDLLHGRAFADQTVTAAQRRCWFCRAGGRFRPGLLQQLQLMQREIAQQVQRVPIDLQLRRFPAGQQQQAADMLLVILQRQAQQAAPVARIGRQEVGGIEMVVELLDVQRLVLRQTVLQQLFIAIIAGQGTGVPLIPPAVQPFSGQGQLGMGHIQQIQLTQRRAAQRAGGFGQAVLELLLAPAACQLGEAGQQPLGIMQRLGQLAEQGGQLKRTHRPAPLRRPGWRARAAGRCRKPCCRAADRRCGAAAAGR